MPIEPCTEKARLTQRYADATLAVAQAGKGIADMQSPEWRWATAAARAEAQEALDAFNRHKQGHGC